MEQKIIRTTDIQDIDRFPGSKGQLSIVSRPVPDGSPFFFSKLLRSPLNVAGKIRKDHAFKDINQLLTRQIPAHVQEMPFYAFWLTDMVEICMRFCDAQASEAISFWLGTDRGCRRYHMDNVPMRLLVTYTGKGTEWLPDEAADHAAYKNRASNEAIVKDPSAIRHMENWDIAIFKGGPNGLLHRTPDAARTELSFLMRLDHSSFWDNVLKFQQVTQSASHNTKAKYA